MPRRLAVGVVAAAALFLAVAGGVVWGHRTQSSAAVLPRADAVAAPSVAVAPDWLAIVRGLEATRSRAVTTADASLLRSVYVTGSPALTADMVTLQRLSGQNLHAVGFSMRPIRVEVLGASLSSATVRVTDEVSAYDISGERTVRHIAPTAPRTFTMLLMQGGGVWRIAEIHR